MLNLIIGVAGTGKTAMLMQRLGEAAAGGAPCVLLVPEQYSFQAELDVVRCVGARLALGVQVLSFTRLCNTVFRAQGGLAGAPLTQTGRYLLMSLAISETQERLRLYKKSALRPDFIEAMTTACAQFKTAGVSPHRLEEIAAACPPGALREKLDDLCIIYTAFGALLEDGYADPDDDIIRASALLREGDTLAGAHVFVDGFATFMAGEFELLSLLIERAGECTFAFTADSLDDAEGGLGVFSPAKEAMRRLRRCAKASGKQVASPTLLTTPHRYHSPDLAHIAEHYPSGNCQLSTVNCQLSTAPDPYCEIEAVAAQISALVREGLRYRDIAIVTRNVAPYLRAVESVFLREGIPFFTDAPRDVENMPLARGLLAALEAIRQNFDSEAVLSYAKNPLAGHAPDEIAACEDYCYIWSVRGKLWEEPWRGSPQGMGGNNPERDGPELERLNATRAAIIAPLCALRERLRECNGRGFGGALFAFLEEINAAGNLCAFAESLPPGERQTFESESAQLWDGLMEILDVFALALGNTTLPTARFCELLRLSLAGAEVALRPQTLDEVLLGSAERVRPGEVAVVFVIGAVQGEFPPTPTPGGVFTDKERETMAGLGAEIGLPTLARTVLERFYCYHALTLASQRLYVSYPAQKLGGEPCRPSPMVDRLRELFPALEAGQAQPEIYSRGGAYEALAANYRDDTPYTATLLHLLGEDGKVGKLDGAAHKREHQISDPALARALFGESMSLSPSRVERYHRCAFSYFARDGLGLRRRERVEFNPLKEGDTLHHVLQVMVGRHGKALHQLGTRQMTAEVGEIIEGYLAERLNNLDAMPGRFKYLFERLGGRLVRLLRRLGQEFAQSEFAPTAFELPITARPEQGRVRPLELVTAEGVRVRVEGVVDRVDVMQRGQNRYVRVVDYKSAGKQFRLDDVVCGLNLQMLLYLFTIAENGQGELGGCIPAGVLYMPVSGKYVSAARDEADEAVHAQEQKQWRMSGLLLDDQEALRGMESELRGVFIPAKMGKDGMDKASALAGKAEMGRLARKIRELIGEMAHCLSCGKIPAQPLHSADFDPCGYCELAPLCAFEPGDAHRTVPKLDRDEVLAMLREGGEHDA